MGKKYVYNYLDTGTVTLAAQPAAGTVTAGPTLQMSRVTPGSLAALVTVEAETNTITLAAVWEVSQDDSTWIRCMLPNNAAEVVLATGTAGDDAALTRVISAPAGVYGHRFARCSIQNGVAQGEAVDTYRVGYNFQRYDLA